jgi:hypothetical protein
VESPSEALNQDASRLRKLEKQNRVLFLFLGVNFAVLLIFGLKVLPNASIQKLEASSISLRDPHGRVIAEIGSEPGLGTDKDLYRPFIKFRDRGDKPAMALYGTGLDFMQGDQRATFDFLGLNISDNEVEFLVNRHLLSYRASGGQLLVLPKKDGMNLTVDAFGEKGEEMGLFGVLTGPKDASVYVAAHNNEIDITADSRGTRVVRGKSQ